MGRVPDRNDRPSLRATLVFFAVVFTVIALTTAHLRPLYAGTALSCAVVVAIRWNDPRYQQRGGQG